MPTVILNACPDCGCFDLRKYFMGGWVCFKCGLTEKEYKKRKLKEFKRDIKRSIKRSIKKIMEVK